MLVPALDDQIGDGEAEDYRRTSNAGQIVVSREEAWRAKPLSTAGTAGVRARDKPSR